MPRKPHTKKSEPKGKLNVLGANLGKLQQDLNTIRRE